MNIVDKYTDIGLIKRGVIMLRATSVFWNILILTLLFVYGGQMNVEAAQIHTQACSDCHRPGLNPRTIAQNLCVNCHDTAVGLFSSGDASNARGHNTAAAMAETSHFWGGSSTNDPASGSTIPPSSFYYSRYQISSGRVTCSICHDPHVDELVKPKLLRAVETDDTICKQCHTLFYVDNSSALLTHPVGSAVVLTSDPLKFNPAVVNTGSGGNVRLLNNTYVSCTSCHGTHWTDSDSSTVDGLTGSPSQGDGKLLRTDGSSAVGATPQETADKRSAICTACHPYKTHGNDTEPVACLVCHSAHVFNPSGAPNYFVLRNSATTAAFGTVTGLNFTAVPPVTASAVWADGSASTANGYCEKCHGNLPTMAGSARAHTEGENCRGCHVHNKSGAIRSFEGSGCDGCHGAPPADATAGTSTGYAVDSANGYNYLTTSGVYKNETTTPHTSHSGTTSVYNFACSFCHNDNFTNTHDKGSFQDVLAATGTFQAAAKPTGSGLNPSYTNTGVGTCNQVACHSNGGARTGDVSPRNYTAPRIAAVWDGGKGDIIVGGVTNCAGCHGNSVATMGNNTTTHNKHLNKGYTCNVCHKDTATSNTVLAAGAANVKHINGTQDVAFAAGGTYTKASGTCSVTCHSTATPDWDTASTGACGTCHQYSVANVATGTGPALGGAHAKHLYAASGGVQLACTVCHTNAGAEGSANTDHVNGVASMVTNYQTTVCNPCHGAQDGITAVGHPDRQPVWFNSTSVTCEGCHTGANTSSWNYGTPVNAPVKNTFASLGHGGVSAFNTAYPTDKCKACHAETGNHFTATADNMLTGGAAANTAFCQTCHASSSFKVHFAAANGSLAGDSCLICHESHGTGMGTNTGKMLTKGSGYTDGTTRASFANASFTGVCQTCHATGASGVKYFNTASDQSGSHQGSAVCTQCHTHSKDPAFMYSAGTGCGEVGGCHFFPPRDNAHILHAPNSNAADLGGPVSDAADMSACEYCHIGADSYTYDPTADRVATLNHGDATNRPSKMTTVGYVKATGRCASACHNGATGVTAAWSDTTLNCSACHYYEDTPSSANNTANANALGGSHNKHFASPYLCTSCHTTPALAGDTTHITNRSGATELAKVQGMATAVAFEADITSAARNTGVDPGAIGSNATCNNLTCHNPSNGAYIATWSVANAVACNFCHSNTNPATNKHGAHLTSGVTITCTKCHVDNGANLAHLNGTKDVTGTSVSSWVSPNCTNSCHGLGSTSWTTGTLNCTDCHTVGKTGLYDAGLRDQAPSSGLHATSNALAHDDNFSTGKTCTSCHQATPTSQHLNGTGPTAFGAGGITYSFATSINSYTANGCAASCHADAAANGGVGKWARRWNGVTDAKPQLTDDPGAAVCDNCHGDGVTAGTSTVDNLWRTGLVPAHQDSPDLDATVEMLTQHGNCKTCHGYGDASYDRTWGLNHGDNELKMNGPVGTGSGYDQTNHGCLAACHTGSLTNSGDANYNHTMLDSGWTIDFANYGSGDCNTCHASAGRDHSGVTSESQLTHDLHTGSELSIGACTQCHPHDGTGANAPGSGVHNVGGTVNFANKIPNTYDYAGNDFGGNCATNTCHDTDDAVEEWKNVSLGGDACADCHASGKTGAFSGLNAYPPTSNKHGLHTANTAIISNCSECHGDNGTLSSVAPYTNHITGGSVAIGGQLTSYTNPTCANSCHNLAGNGSGAATWLTANANPLGCADCHNKAANTIGTPIYATLSTTVGPTGDKHAAHTAADADYVANCATCHNHNGTLGSFATTGHVNAVQKTLVGTITVNGDKSCTNSCHLAATANEWISGTLVCTDCHTQATKTLGAGGDATMSGTVAPNSGKHTVHMGNNTYVPSDCTSCHTHSGSLAVAGHVNGPARTNIEVANSITVSPIPADKTCTNNCHITADGRDWTVGTLLCADCHNADGNAADLGTFSLDQGNWPPTSYNHNEHIISNALGGSGNASQNDCYACHNTTVNNAGVLLIANHANGTPLVAFNSTFGYEGVAATKAVAGVNQSCASVLCHNGVTTPLWNAASITCGDCHGTAATDDPKPVSASTAGSHTLHVDGTIGDYTDCAKCHNGAGSYTATGGTNHQNLVVNYFGFVSATSDATGNNTYTDTTEGGVNYQAGDATHVDNGTCSNIDCHYTATPTWGAAAQGTPARCDNCHNDGTPDDTLTSAAPATGEHVAHIAASTSYVDDCASCHGAGANTGTHTGHANLSVNINAAVISLWDNTNNTCTNSCHLASTGDWDNDAPIVGGTLVCTDCHTQATKTLGAGGSATMSGTVAPTTGKHTAHMNNTAFAGQCTDCHTHSGALATAGHVNGPTKTDIEVANSITVSPIPVDDTCTNNCHIVADGRDWTVGTLLCADCHNASLKTMNQGAWPPTSYNHNEHVISNALGGSGNAAQNDCYACHNSTTNNAGALLTANFLHANGTPTVAFNSTFGYEGVAATKAVAGVNQSCASVLCHNGVTTPLWNAATIACGDCHGTAATDDPAPISASTAGSHTLHVDGTIGDYTDCAKCHNGAGSYTATGGTNHQNLAVNLFGFVSATSDATGNNTYTDTTEGGVNYQAGDATHVDNGTCSNIDCHYTGTPTWGAAAQGAPQRCDNCHNDGTPDDTLTSAVPATGEHAAHIAASTNYVDDCAGCHGAGANTGTHTGHGNLTLNLDAAVVSTWDNNNNTCTNSCHLASNGDWDNDAPIVGGTLVCIDCHTQTTLTLGAVGSATMSGSVAPTTGKHTIHMGNTAFAGQCTDCHSHSGALATAGHVNGPAKTNIEVANSITVSPIPADDTCTNNCHNVSALDDNWATGTLECTDCHNAATKSMNQGAWPPTSNKHTQHVSTATNAAYGDTVDHTTTTAYEFGCGSCHGNTAANHANASVNVTVTNWTAAAKTCGQNSCHNDGKATPGAPAATADWDAASPAQTCNICHGNAPTTGAHSAHAVGIHYQDIYTGTTGRATAGTLNTSSHGNSTTSTTISCNLCHNGTVTTSRNRLGSQCTSCHSGDLATTNIAIADKTKHLDGGTTKVVFANVNVKSKAQVRNDITTVTELNSTWTRTGGYKVAGAYDAAKSSLTAAGWNGTSCSTVSCHNGKTISWTTPANDCTKCHMALP